MRSVEKRCRSQPSSAPPTMAPAPRQPSSSPYPTALRPSSRAREHGQERPERAGAHYEGSAPDEHGAHRGRVPEIAHARADRAGHALGRHDGGARLLLPAPQHEDHGEERRRVDEEHGTGAERRDEEPADGGPDGAGDVGGDPVERHRLGQLGRRDEIGGRGLPGRRVERDAEPEVEGEEEQEPRRHRARNGEQAENRGGGEHPALGDDEQAAAVHDVGQRAGGEGQEEHRETGRRLHERHQHRRGARATS